MEFDVTSLRKEFPVLERKTYLNNASYCALANSVKQAIGRHMDDRLLLGANWEVWITKCDAVRRAMAEILRADPDGHATRRTSRHAIASTSTMQQTPGLTTGRSDGGKR